MSTCSLSLKQFVVIASVNCSRSRPRPPSVSLAWGLPAITKANHEPVLRESRYIVSCECNDCEVNDPPDREDQPAGMHVVYTEALSGSSVVIVTRLLDGGPENLTLFFIDCLSASQCHLRPYADSSLELEWSQRTATCSSLSSVNGEEGLKASLHNPHVISGVVLN